VAGTEPPSGKQEVMPPFKFSPRPSFSRERERGLDAWQGRGGDSPAKWRGGGSGLAQQIDVTVLLGAGETAVDGSRLLALHRIGHFASADHALALTAVQVGRVTQTALTTLWPSVEAEEVPTRYDQLYGAHAPEDYSNPPCIASAPKPLDRGAPGTNGPVLAGNSSWKPSRERENPPKRALTPRWRQSQSCRPEIPICMDDGGGED
jgi:hypothetical protein